MAVGGDRRAVPPSAGRRPASTRSSVDLPDPLGPTSPTRAPGASDEIDAGQQGPGPGGDVEVADGEGGRGRGQRHSTGSRGIGTVVGAVSLHRPSGYRSSSAPPPRFPVDESGAGTVRGDDGACGRVRRGWAHGKHRVPGRGRRSRARARRRHRPAPRRARPAPRHRGRRARPAHRPRPGRPGRRPCPGGGRLHGARRLPAEPGVGGRARHPRRGGDHRLHRRRPRAVPGAVHPQQLPHRPELRHRGGAHDALRRAGRAVVRDGRGDRAAPRPQGRRPVGHGHADGRPDGRRLRPVGRRPHREGGPGRGTRGRPDPAASTCTRSACGA